MSWVGLIFLATGLVALADEAAVSAGSDSLDLASAIVKTARGDASGLRLAAALGGSAPWSSGSRVSWAASGRSPLSFLGAGRWLVVW